MEKQGWPYKSSTALHHDNNNKTWAKQQSLRYLVDLDAAHHSSLRKVVTLLSDYFNFLVEL